MARLKRRPITALKYFPPVEEVPPTQTLPTSKRSVTVIKRGTLPIPTNVPELIPTPQPHFREIVREYQAQTQTKVNALLMLGGQE